STHRRKCSTNSYSKVGAQTRRVLLQRIDTAATFVDHCAEQERISQNFTHLSKTRSQKSVTSTLTTRSSLGGRFTHALRINFLLCRIFAILPSIERHRTQLHEKPYDGPNTSRGIAEAAQNKFSNCKDSEEKSHKGAHQKKVLVRRQILEFTKDSSPNGRVTEFVRGKDSHLRHQVLSSRLHTSTRPIRNIRSTRRSRRPRNFRNKSIPEHSPPPSA